MTKIIPLCYGMTAAFINNPLQKTAGLDTYHKKQYYLQDLGQFLLNILFMRINFQF